MLVGQIEDDTTEWGELEPAVRRRQILAEAEAAAAEADGKYAASDGLFKARIDNIYTVWYLN